MEDTNMPLESVKFWSGTVRPHNNNTKNQNSNSNNNNNTSFLKVHVKQGMLLHITGACIWDDINEGEDNNAVITTPGRAILQVIVSDNNNNNNKGPSTAGTLCVLNDGGKYGNGPVNATLAAYFETDVQFRVIGNKSVHIYGHLVDARTDMPLDEEDEDAVRQQTSTTTNTIIAPINKNQKDEEHNTNNFNSINGHKRDRSDSSSSSSSDSGSSSSSSSSDAEDDDDDSQLKQQKKKQKLLKNNNNKKQLLDDVSNALVNIIKVSPRKSVKLNDLGTLYKEATNNNLKHQTGTRLTKYLEEHSDIFTLNQRDQSVEIKNAHLYF